MEARDILTAKHELEETGMTRSQSEAIAQTIVAAVEPLTTRADLEAIKTDMKSIKEQMVTKADLESDSTSLKEQMATKAALESGISSVKIWYLVTLLGLIGSLLAIDAI